MDVVVAGMIFYLVHHLSQQTWLFVRMITYKLHNITAHLRPRRAAQGSLYCAVCRYTDMKTVAMSVTLTGSCDMAFG